MSEQIVNGYLVVSAPDGGRYRGVDRQPWEIIDAGYFSGGLPDDIRRLYEDMREVDRRGLWWPTSTSREDATRMQAFTRAQEVSTELIAIHSPYLRGEVDRREWTEESARFLGVDVISVGEWSLLQALARAGVSLPGDIASQLNNAGLLQDESAAKLVDACYRELSSQDTVEPIADLDSGILVEALRIYLLDI